MLSAVDSNCISSSADGNSRIGFEKYDVVVEALDPSHILDKDPQ